MKRTALLIFSLLVCFPLAAADPPSQSPQSPKIAGEIFGTPVPMGNYAFAHVAAQVFGPPWGCSGQSGEDCEKLIWENLLLHYLSFQRDIKISEEKMEEEINAVLRDQGQNFTRKGDPEAYRRWVKEKLNEEVTLFENQIRYLSEIKELKEQVSKTFTIIPSEDDARERFLDERSSLGGEMAVFPTRPEAEAFLKTVSAPGAWERAKQKGPPQNKPIKPVTTMSLQAYIDLWRVPKPEMKAIFGKGPGPVVLMPFGTQWAAFKVTETKPANASDFPAHKEHYLQQVERIQKAKKLKEWIEELKRQAAIRTQVP